MSSIATLLAEGGHAVSGSDLEERPILAGLRSSGVRVEIGHDPANLGDLSSLTAVVVSTAVSGDNPEVLAARRAGIPVMNRTEFLPLFGAQQPFVSVSGTHGKTTTASFLAVALRGAGVDPSWLLGAPVPALGGAASLGGGELLVLEADESDGSFMAGPRAASMLTNAEPDHLEFWGGWEELEQGFSDFLASTQGPTLACADDPGSAAVGRNVGARTWGLSGDDHRMLDLRLDTSGSEFDLDSGGEIRSIRVGMPGGHNAVNAAGAVAMAVELGVDADAAAAAIPTHTGLHRRFERRGSAAGVEVVDDYAHLPTEVTACLSAARNSGWHRVVAAFQPHRYSRTQALWREFGECFEDCDELILTEIYGAGEEPRDGVSGELLLTSVHEAARRSGRPTGIHWAPTVADVARLAADLVQPGDVFLTVGAGDIRDAGDLLLGSLAE
jgi:UDP-N-acetylmuramate--alanine ligase